MINGNGFNPAMPPNLMSNKPGLGLGRLKKQQGFSGGTGVRQLPPPFRALAAALYAPMPYPYPAPMGNVAVPPMLNGPQAMMLPQPGIMGMPPNLQLQPSLQLPPPGSPAGQ